jgi:hypothetical protein
MSTGPLGGAGAVGAGFLTWGDPCLGWVVALPLGAAFLDEVDLIKLFFPIKTPLSEAAFGV